jgi:glycosyltransferase involved in cell wall biosynthesis
MTDSLNWDAYDLVYLEYSRYGFIAQEAKKHQKKLVVRVHNVERDYFFNRVTEKKSLQNSLRSLIKRNLITRQERLCLHSADCVICLTASDKARLSKLYPEILDKKELMVIPVALEEPCPPATLSINLIDAAENNPYLLITGSLWFGPNAEGSAWFIKNVWYKLMAENRWISSNLRLIIAGSRPGKLIQVLAAGQDNIEIIDSPKAMKPYFENALIYLAPIFTGAGMKVKVAEALSYGLPVIATSHALTGYKIIDRENGYRADCADEYIESLEHYARLSVEDKSLFKKKAYQLFLDDHSIVESKKSFQKIISDLVQK